jgi:hypothetical protein
MSQVQNTYKVEVEQTDPLVIPALLEHISKNPSGFTSIWGATGAISYGGYIRSFLHDRDAGFLMIQFDNVQVILQESR